MLVGAWLAALLVFMLASRLPEGHLFAQAGELRAAVADLGWALSEPDAPTARVQAARSMLDRRLAALADSAAHSAIDTPELATFRLRLHALPEQPGGAAVRTLASAAEHLAQALAEQLDARHQQLERWIRGLAALLALALTLPIHGLWRQRRRMRASLHRFSETLDSRIGLDGAAPSAFGAQGESDRRWRALADLSADWYWETDAEHRFDWISGAAPAVKALGWSEAELLGRRRDQLPCLEAPALGWQDLHARLDRREAFRDLEFRILGRNGRHAVWVSISGRARHDTHGRFVGYEGVGHDITARKDAHERLAASEQRWSLMAGLASDWYWQTDAEHRILPLAPEFKRRFPQIVDRSVGHPRWVAHAGCLSAAEWAAHRADLDARRPFRSLLLEVDVGDGRWLWLSISGIPRFDGQGRFVGYHGVGRDITVRKHAERLLMRHNEELQGAVATRTRELEQLNRDLEAFSRQLAHELRTPIGHVQGLAQLIGSRAAERLTDDERRLLALQVQAAHSMRETVDALMQLARSTVQAMPMETVDVSGIAAHAVAELPPLQRRGPVDWQIEPGLQAQAAPAALRIVLSNLLGNAAKFTRNVAEPQVRVSGRIDADGRLRIAVQDNGAGFEQADAARLFVPFNRLHAGDEFHGTGIGLSIVQRIVERHGGSVSARGEIDRGACFEFTLAPLAA